MTPIEQAFKDAFEAYDFEDGREVTLHPQVHITHYIADFVLTENNIQLVVECDGHEWHNRTKEQAERDRRRDRDLLIAGYPTIRFTGSELIRDAAGCVAECLSVLYMLDYDRSRWASGIS